jgi:O-antigen ligase/Flp pilus assembly protein TadD
MVERIQKTLLGILFAWVPLAYFTPAADAFTLSKEIPAVAGLVFLLAQALPGGPKKVWETWLVRSVVLFFAWMLADSLAVAPMKMEVLKGSIHLFLMAGALTAVAYACLRGHSYERLLHYALFAGAVMSAFGLIQSLGWDQARWTTSFEGRAFSTVGNPNYLGGHLAGLLPVALVLCLRSTTSKVRLGWGLVTLILLLGIFTTRVRGSELALGASFIFMGLVFLFPWGRELASRNRGFILAGMVIALTVGAFFITRHGGLSSFHYSQASVQQRWETYRVAWEMVKANALFGIGLGQVGSQYPLYQSRPYSSGQYPLHPYTLSEHIHQEFLQFWVEGGLFGLLLFFAVLAAFLAALARTLRHPQTTMRNREILIGTTAAVIALLVQSLSNFPFQIAPTVLVFGLCLAGPLALEPAGEKTVHSGGGSKTFSALPVALAILTVIIGGRAMAASIAYRNTNGENRLGNPANAVYFGKRLTELSAWNPKAWTAYAKALALARQKDPAREACKKSLSLDPNNAQNWAQAAELEADAGHFDEAVGLCEKAENIAPNYPIVFWEEGTYLFQLQRYEEAAGKFNKYLEYDPGRESAYLNLGVCCIKLGRKAEAVEAWKNALALNPADAQAVQYLKANGIILSPAKGTH